MAKYRRKMGKPIEAVQWRPGVEHPGVIKNGNGFAVMTILGQLAYLAEGDWILPELMGDEPDGKHFYPCKPDIFAKTFEPVEAADGGAAAIGFNARIAELEAQLQAEGEHTAAANANIDRLNTEIERVTRCQQGPLMGKD